MSEARRSFECFGGWASIAVLDPTNSEPDQTLADAEAFLLAAHRRLSRFLPGSELSRLNSDTRTTVPAEPLLLDLAAAAREAGELTDGMVDATMVSEIEAAGYRDSMPAGPRGAVAAAGREAAVPREAVHGPPKEQIEAPAGPSPERAWEKISTDRASKTISRPPGVAIDSGGIAKGLLADQVASLLSQFPAFMVDCCGDIRIGGAACRPRPVRVESPFGGEAVHTLRVVRGGVATSGITRRSWRGADGAPAHHLLDPATGRPAFTGIVQATALAPTAFLADVHAKWALLSGPELGPSLLPFGGVLVLSDGSIEAVQPQAAVGAAT
ncbi:MAG TPA: FAD:protein FMN transferase [Solirubrobacterales bacterium]|nr:FAD:protein FMN transferase [Solirubrobacterales bacterium]